MIKTTADKINFEIYFDQDNDFDYSRIVFNARANNFNLTAPIEINIDQFDFKLPRDSDKGTKLNLSFSPTLVAKISDTSGLETEYYKVEGLKSEEYLTAWMNEIITAHTSTGTQNGSGTNNSGSGNNSGDINSFGLGCNIFDQLIESLGLGSYKKYVFGGASVFLAYKAVGSETKIGQIGFGGGSAYLAYLALTATGKPCMQKTKV